MKNKYKRNKFNKEGNCGNSYEKIDQKRKQTETLTQLIFFSIATILTK